MALALGRTVAELENSISNTELSEWIEYYRLEPFMADRSEIQLAQLSQMVAGFMGSKMKVTEFMPSQKETKKDKEKLLAMQVKSLFGGKNK